MKTPAYTAFILSSSFCPKGPPVVLHRFPRIWSGKSDLGISKCRLLFSNSATSPLERLRNLLFSFSFSFPFRSIDNKFDPQICSQFSAKTPLAPFDMAAAEAKAQTELKDFPSLFSLEGKVVVVTGGSRGLGLHAASACLLHSP